MGKMELTKREKKKNAILDSASKVFRKNGFSNTTMQDIVNECGISRGGIYLYYDSIDKIFMEVINRRTSVKFDGIRKLIQEDLAFEILLEQYFNEHKIRLLTKLENSLLRATYEYYFTNKTKEVYEFQNAQMVTMKEIILQILTLGKNQGEINNRNLNNLAENYMFVIEGMGILALTGGISEEKIDHQFTLMKLLLSK